MPKPKAGTPAMKAFKLLPVPRPAPMGGKRSPREQAGMAAAAPKIARAKKGENA